MTVRELIQQILSETPDLDANVYINEILDFVDVREYNITRIDSYGANDSLTLEIKSIKF